MRKIICLLAALVVAMSMSSVAADAAGSFSAAPTGVKATCASGVAIQVSYKAKAGATGYKIYVAKKGGKYKAVKTTKKQTVKVGGLTAGTTYYIKVRAYKGKILKTYSNYSKAVKCKTVLAAPKFSAVTVCDCKISLTMRKTAGSQGFVVYRSTKPSGGFTEVKKTKASNKNTTITWTDKELKGSTTYYYKVKQYAGTYKSPASAAKGATTQKWLGDGNDLKYDPEKCRTSNLDPAPAAAPGNGENALNGRNILFLGSSVTYGSATGGNAFPDYIANRNNLGTRAIDCVKLRNREHKVPEAGSGVVWKEAVSGTTMARGKADSYVDRLSLYSNYTVNPDIFACQLSLNDALDANNVPLGTLPDINFNTLNSTELNKLYNKANTVGGAIGYITAFAYYHWPNCQLVFYTVRNNGENDQYAKMRKLLLSAKTKYGKYDLTIAGDGTGYKNRNRIEIIDVWNDPEITNLIGNYFCFYMSDKNHPNEAGSLYQWTPLFEPWLIAYMPPAAFVEPDDWDALDQVPEGDTDTQGDQNDSSGSAGSDETDGPDATGGSAGSDSLTGSEGQGGSSGGETLDDADVPGAGTE